MRVLDRSQRGAARAGEADWVTAPRGRFHSLVLWEGRALGDPMTSRAEHARTHTTHTLTRALTHALSHLHAVAFILPPSLSPSLLSPSLSFL